jgi:hypothetical protein
MSNSAKFAPLPVETEEYSEQESAPRYASLGSEQSGRLGRRQRPMHQFLLFVDLGIIWVAAAAVQESCLLALRLAPSLPLSAAWPSGSAGFVLLFSVLVVLFARIHGLYEWPWKGTLRQEIIQLAKSVAYALALAEMSTVLWNVSISFRAFVLPTVAASIALLATWRKFVRSQSISGLTATRNVLIVGCGPNGQTLRRHLEQHPELGYVFRGYLDRRGGGRAPDPERNPEEGCILGPADQL